MIDHRTLRPGTRVRLHSHPIGLILTSFTGAILDRDPLWDDYYLVQLDRPAYERPCSDEQTPVELSVIREAVDNLDVTDEA